MKFKALRTILTITLIYGCVAPPVSKNKEKPNEEVDSDGLENYMEYHRYLREVVNTLESDPEFKKKLEQASEEEIRSGKIAHELEFVGHHVRTRLDEIKRTELVRLRELMAKKSNLENNSVDDPTHHHLDHGNPHTFEIEDLKKLIIKTTEDLAEADRKRRDEFKQYEMQKEFEKQEKLNHTAGDERDKLEKEYNELEEKHKKHDKLHEPGHKQQLEEVWEEQDHMQQDFDPKTFFMLHDLDGNGLWDETEVKALFIKELDKMYSAGAPEDDMKERAEEMERMRESVFREVDSNRDGFIDYNEFIAQTRRGDFQQDNGWQGIDEQKPYTDEELEEYIRQHQAQQAYYQQHMAPPGMPHPGQMPPPGMAYHGQVPPPGMGHPGQMPPAGMAHPGQMPQQMHPGQMQQPGAVNPGQMNQQHMAYQGQGNQAYQGQPPQAYHGQAPQGYQGQAPQAYQGQAPQAYQGQAPQGQYNPQYHNQVPPGGYQQNVGQGQAVPQIQPVQQGQMPQAHVNSPPHNVNSQGNMPDLNTNEVYPNAGQQHQANQANAVPQAQANVQPQQPNYQNQPPNYQNQPPPQNQPPLQKQPPPQNQPPRQNQPPPQNQPPSQNQPPAQNQPNYQQHQQANEIPHNLNNNINKDAQH